MMHGQEKSDNEIYFMIKYIKSVLWRVAKCLFYIEEARCLKVNAYLLISKCRTVLILQDFIFETFQIRTSIFLVV